MIIFVDLEYKKIRRRRRRHREPSVSPVLLVNGSDKPISPSPKLDPEVLCQEPDYPNKCSFLGSFSLGTVENEKKKGLFYLICVQQRRSLIIPTASD